MLPSFCCYMQHTEKLEKVVEEGNYYGAQQMYKSISARYMHYPNPAPQTIFDIII